MATAYVSIALMAAVLALGPLNLLRRRPNPVSTDLRRDVAIWAGLTAVAHFVVGLQVHMKHRWLYFVREVPGSGALVPRADLFGFANDTGLVATLIVALLLVLSNDLSLRQLGTRRWKSLQRWNYAAAILVLAHGIAYQVIEKRHAPFVLVFAVVVAAALAAQGLGIRRVRSRR